jgi:hypothetical protein
MQRSLQSFPREAGWAVLVRGRHGKRPVGHRTRRRAHKFPSVRLGKGRVVDPAPIQVVVHGAATRIPSCSSRPPTPPSRATPPAAESPAGSSSDGPCTSGAWRSGSASAGGIRHAQSVRGRSPAGRCQGAAPTVSGANPDPCRRAAPRRPPGRSARASPGRRRTGAEPVPRRAPTADRWRRRGAGDLGRTEGPNRKTEEPCQ